MTTDDRPLLLSLAYRMLGNMADAEDVVQEAYLRFGRSDRDDVATPRAFLIRVVTRLCVDFHRSARVRRERTFGVELPEPLDEARMRSLDASPADDRVELSQSLSVAFLVVLETLSPTERAVYLLHEVFEYDYEEVARLVGKSEVHCRQIVSRAKRHVSARRPRFRAGPPIEDVVLRFVSACANGELSPLMELLAPDVVLYADGGDGSARYGNARAVGKPLEGASMVARFLVQVQKQAAPGTTARVVRVNGAPAVASFVDGTLTGVLSFDVIGGRVRAVFVHAAPRKLVGLASALADAPS